MFAIESILDENIRNDNIKTRTVLVSPIANKRSLARIISFLNEKIPFSQFSLLHLKRINSKSDPCKVIIAPTPEGSCVNDSELISKSLSQFGEELKRFLDENELNNLKVQEVAHSLPLTRPQFEKASSLWPVNFHENKHISKCLNGTLFSPEQLKTIFSLMRETLDLSEANSSPSCSSMAAIIVKKDRQFKVTSAVSQTSKSPLNHAAIVAIENVAHIHQKAKSRDDGDESAGRHYDGDYLCTNYECFLSQDPCIMCAMALVHSRISRVFIYDGAADKVSRECNDKAYQIHKLHILPNLNHHYEVWKLSTPHPPAVELWNGDQIPNKRPRTDVDQ